MTATLDSTFVHRTLSSGVEFAADVLPDRQTVAIHFRVLTGVADEPPELSGINSIVERTLSKGTQRYTGQQFADAFDALGAQWGSSSGRQSTLARVLCLPEFAIQASELIAEMLCKPTFPEEAVSVAVELAQEELTHMEDDPQELLRRDAHLLTYGPNFGRHPGGDADTLPRITRNAVVEHWRRCYSAGRLQVVAAGPIDADALAQRVDQLFSGFGDKRPSGRNAANYEFRPGRNWRNKELKQQYIGITLEGAAKDSPKFAIEQVMIGVLSGGMSGRLFTEVREKQGLVYWVAAWNEQPRGRGVINLGASTTPERCAKTYETLLREINRLGEDLTDEETQRARNQIIAHMSTEDDLTRARSGGLSDDLFHFGKPVGPQPKLDAIARVTTRQVAEYARGLSRDRLCVATVGPVRLD